MKTQATLVAVLAAAMTLAGCSSSNGSTAAQGTSGGPAPSAPVVQPAARGVEGAIGSIPWSQVGPGWMLATWSPVVGNRPGVEPTPGEPTRETATVTLYLVDPAGGRYPITTFPPPGNRAGLELVDWSGDGSHALFYGEYDKPQTVIDVDLHTGTQTRVPIAEGVPRFARPDGTALLVTNHFGDYRMPAGLERVDLAGKQQFTYPTDKLDSKFNGPSLFTPDGTRLVLGTSAGLVVMGDDGAVVSTLSMPDRSPCTPVRWWDEQPGAIVVAQCVPDGDRASRLWLVPLDGSAPTPLTALKDGLTGPDYADLDAWKLPTGTYVQAMGACGVVFLAKVNADGTTSEVDVPNTEGSVGVLGANGGHLYLHTKAGCGGGQAIIDYDPAANTSTVLLGGPLNGGGVDDARLYGSQK
ncbi:MAG TPA: hypothetical protein VL634_15670 [Mycobacterium sp.]|nr:hypothetical protein [Mycobacterium sp.]